MLRSDVTVEQRMHKLCNRLRRQHARSPALLPIFAIVAFLLISLILYLVSSASSASKPSHASFLHASVLAPATDSTDSPAAAFKPGITPQRPAQPLTVRALSALRAQLDGRILVHDFEACIGIRRMMALVGEDREAGRRDGTAESDVDLDTYLAQLRQRVDEEDSEKQQQRQAALAVKGDDNQPSQTQQQLPPSNITPQQQMAAMQEEWRGKVLALQEQVRELQAAQMEAQAAAAAVAREAEENGDAANLAADGQRRGGKDSRRITYSKIKPHSDNASQSQHQQQQQQEGQQPLPPHSPTVPADGLPDIVQSPEEALVEKQTAQQQAGQPVSADEPHEAAVIAAAGAGEPAVREKAGFVAGIHAAVGAKDSEAEQQPEEEHWGKWKWKKRWAEKEPGKGKKQEDDDD